MKRRLALLAAMFGAGACATGGAPDAVAGNWVVTHHVAPGISAMSPEEADAWIGTRASFSSRDVVFGNHSCQQPDYQAGTLDERGFQEGFRVSATRLGIDSDSVATFDVACAGRDWVAPGSFVIVDGERLVTVWDGVFFELRRDPEPR